MAAVCYTCYRPARTGYVRQSIALILALGAAHTEGVSVDVCAAVPVVYRSIPLRSPSRRVHPLHLVSQELHHQVITSTSYLPPPLSLVLPASHPDAFTGPRSFPKPSAACHPRIIAKPSSRKSREIDVSKRRTWTRSFVISVFGSSLLASFVLRRRAISAEFRSCLKSHKSFTLLIIFSFTWKT